MQTVTVVGARRDDGSVQVCLWATLPGVGEVFVVSGQTVALPLVTDVTAAIAQGRLTVLPETIETDQRVVVDRAVDVGDRGLEAPVKRVRK